MSREGFVLSIRISDIRAIEFSSPNLQYKC